MELQVDLGKIIGTLWNKFFLIVISGALFLMAGVILTPYPEPDVYTARSTIYSASSASYKDSVEGINVMRDYVDILGSRKVAERASAHLAKTVSAAQIMRMVSTSYQDRSAIMVILASSGDPELSIAVANAVADAFVYELLNITSVDTVKVLDSASSAVKTFDGVATAWRTRAVITLAGVFLAAAVIVVTTVFDTRVSSVNEVTLGGEIKLLGILPENR